MATDDILGQADALMRRHRSFVARIPGDDAPSAATAPTEEADIPLLTEIVDADAAAVQDLDAVLAMLADEIDDALSSWLVEVLPAAVANASQQILAELDAKARHTLLPRLREILAARASPSGQDGTGVAERPSV